MRRLGDAVAAAGPPVAVRLPASITAPRISFLLRTSTPHAFGLDPVHPSRRAPQVEVLYIVIAETGLEINRISPYLLIQLESSSDGAPWPFDYRAIFRMPFVRGGLCA